MMLRSVVAPLAIATLAVVGSASAQVATLPAFEGRARDVRLGIAFATMVELEDAPTLLRRPSVARVVAGDEDALQAAAPGGAASAALATVRRDLDAGPSGDRLAADRDLGALEQRYLAALGHARARRFLVGALAEQIFYNARVLREPGADRASRALLLRIDDADAVVPGTSAARAALGAATSADWPTIERLSRGLVAAILGSSDAVPFASGPGVWVVLLRTRATDADAVRRGAPHFALDVVRFDGTRTTYAAYPGGAERFGHDAATLPCLADQEPAGRTLRAVPVPPPPGTTPDQLARAIRTGCAAAAAAPAPYVAAEASDDRLVVNLLVASGIDVTPLLRAAKG